MSRAIFGFRQLVIWFMLLAGQPALSFSSSGSPGDIHGDILRDALHGTVSDTNIAFMAKAESSQDTAGSEGAGDSRRHFADSNFQAALAYIDREKKKALNYAAEADTDEASRGQALRHFALALHTAQDFYSRTNYAELQLEDPIKKRDPFNLELVDWSRVPDGYTGKTSGAPLSVLGKGGDINKDSEQTEHGKAAIAGTSYFKVAKELAIRETQRQWNLFEALIRARFHGRADAIITALKSANPGNSSDSVPDLD